MLTCELKVHPQINSHEQVKRICKNGFAWVWLDTNLIRADVAEKDGNPILAPFASYRFFSSYSLEMMNQSEFFKNFHLFRLAKNSSNLLRNDCEDSES